MNHNEREQFWQTLCSLPGNDIVAEREQLLKSIKYPKLLFRYRPVSTKSLEALRTNRLYFSSANYYDDPFDTFLHIDIERIRKVCLSAFQTPESIEAAVAGVRPLLVGILSEEQAARITGKNVTAALSQGIVESFLNEVLSIRDEIKKDTWSVCFSENGFNEALWLKYADQHRGFVQVYDLENNDNFLCGKQEKCSNCGIRNYGTPLYPIYYSDTPYDATKFAKFVMLRKIAETTETQIPQELYEGRKVLSSELDDFIPKASEVNLKVPQLPAVKAKCPIKTLLQLSQVQHQSNGFSLKNLLLGAAGFFVGGIPGIALSAYDIYSSYKDAKAEANAMSPYIKAAINQIGKNLNNSIVQDVRNSHLKAKKSLISNQEHFKKSIYDNF